MKIQEFNQILVSYLKKGITEAVIRFDNTGITNVEPIETNNE